MAEGLVFDYYYGNEAEQFAFYRVPKLLIKDGHFSGLSSDAKLLYGLMLDRMSLSIKNGWLDDENRAYIIYTVEQISEDLGCGRDKAMKVVAELDMAKGIGLIEKVRRGLGKPDIIYVKNFVINSDSSSEKVEIEPANPDKFTEVGKADFKRSEKPTSGSRKNRLQEVEKTDFKKSEKSASRGRKNRFQEVGESDTNNTDKSNTEQNDTDFSNTDFGVREESPIHQSKRGYKPLSKNDGLDDGIGEVISYLKKKTDYDSLVASYPLYQRNLDEMLQIMAEAILCSSETIRIGNMEIPQKLVRMHFEEYDYSMMEYVLDRMKANTTKVHNIKAYLLAVLYNAPLTVNNFYSAEVQHDMYGGGWQETIESKKT